MYDLEIIIEDGRYWLQAISEKRAEIHLLSTTNLAKLAEGLNIALRQNLEVDELAFKIRKHGGNKFTLYLKSGYSYFGYHLSKSKLTAFRNQLVGVLNG